MRKAIGSLLNKLLELLLPYWIIGYYLGTNIPSRQVYVLWFGTLYLLAFFAIAFKFKKLLTLLLQEPLALLLIGLSGLSWFWSVAPEITFASFRSLIVQYVLAGLLVISYKPAQLIGIIAKALSACGLISAFYIVFIPHIGIRGSSLFSSSWRGVFSHQSVLAGVMGMAIISLVYFGLYQKIDSTKGPLHNWFLLPLAICSVVLIFCGAKTALVSLIASFVVLPMFFLKKIRKIKERTVIFFTLLYILLFGTATVYAVREFIVVELLGKSLDLTGRSDTWEFLISKLSERPILGFGLDAFWHNKQISNEFAGIVGRQIPSIYNSHNGHLDIAVGLGYVGAFFLGIFVLRVVSRSIVFALNSYNIAGFWSLQISVFILIAGYSDTFIGLLKARGLAWLIFSTAYLLVIYQMKGLGQERVYISDNPYLRKTSRFARVYGKTV
ncbi:O-antigen ligase family protein [Nodosilinea sp. PGN35]|uniref:O-antigen ligase family protein n=1 Tax=Nodosilinea sp. PGN35 TaxID=3020489 RepID=UPI0023B29375|nr:O-antigen ligase family protein [Nodosilinea sp. TSF1-S3]MDF0367315.1 O-antigen ligase family protein [Nodosilinea sp. TSF1-S3]